MSEQCEVDRAVWREIRDWLEIAKDSDSLDLASRQRLENMCMFVDGILRSRDFECDHHDPLRDGDVCGLCATAIRLTFVEMADIPGAPMNTIQLVDTIREIADRKVQLLRRNPDYNFMWDVG